MPEVGTGTELDTIDWEDCCHHHQGCSQTTTGALKRPERVRESTAGGVVIRRIEVIFELDFVLFQGFLSQVLFLVLPEMRK